MLIGDFLNVDELLDGEMPRGDRVFVLPLIDGVRTKQGIIIPDAHRDRPQRGIVLAVGSGGTAPESGRPVIPLSAVGDLVRYGKYAGQTADFESVDLLIMRDHELNSGKPEGRYELVVHDQDWRKVHLAGFVCEHCEAQPAQPWDGTDRRRALQELAYGTMEPPPPAPGPLVEIP